MAVPEFGSLYSYSLSNREFNVPKIFTYANVKNTDSPVVLTPGLTYSYTSIANTPWIKSLNATVISVDKKIFPANLKIYFDEYPLGTKSNWYGTCVFTYELNSLPFEMKGWFHRSDTGGTCDNGLFRVRVTGSNGKNAIVHYRNDQFPYINEIAFVLEKD